MPGGGEIVGEAGHQRRLRARPPRSRCALSRQKRDDGGVVGHVERHALGHLGDAGIAGRAIELAEQRAGRNRPGQRVLAAAGADEENVHQRNPAKALESRRANWPRTAPSSCIIEAVLNKARGKPLAEPVRAARQDAQAWAPISPEFSVSELSAAIKRTLEGAFGYVRLRGEISGFRGAHSSGHCYFALKDDKAKIEAVIWRTTVQGLKFKPAEGLEVIATGRITTYPGKSNYQIVIDALEPAGVGALMALLEERKKKLAAEGLFDEARKKPLPFLPRVIGIVTSPTGAVIRDMLHGFDERFPARVLVWPVRVQGETCAAEVAAAIRGFNALPRGRTRCRGPTC